MKKLILLANFIIACHLIAQTGPARISIDTQKEISSLRPFWTYFGYDEPNFTYMPDGKKLLSEISELSPLPVYVRTHNLLTTREGAPSLKWGFTNAYTEDANGNPVYEWTLLDSIVDCYILSLQCSALERSCRRSASEI